MLNISYQNIKLCLLQYEKTNALVDVYKTITVDKYFNFDFTNYIGFTGTISGIRCCLLYIRNKNDVGSILTSIYDR